MTVQAQEPTVSVDRVAAEQQLEDAYRRWWKPLTYFIFARIDVAHRSDVEEIASDAFMALWDEFLLRGRDVYAPWGLLCYLARRKIGYFYSGLPKRRTEALVDWSDPLNRGLEVGHSYAAHQPEAATLAAELSDAMETMTELSKKWREAHTKTSMYRSRLNSDTFNLRPETREATEQRLTVLTAESSKLLKDFRAACGMVGDLRRDLEAAGGPNWQSSTGMPASTARNWTKGKGTMSEPTRTHCDDGHELTLDNTLFTPKGAKRCRTCMEISWRAGRAAKPKREPKQWKPGKQPNRIPDEKIEQARQLLKDRPELSIRQVAAMLGLNRSTLSSRIGAEMDQLRNVDRTRVTGISPELLDKAVQLLTDPDHRRNVRSVCRELGFSDATLYTRVPNLSELRAKAYGGRTRVLAGAAR